MPDYWFVSILSWWLVKEQLAVVTGIPSKAHLLYQVPPVLFVPQDVNLSSFWPLIAEDPWLFSWYCGPNTMPQNGCFKLLCPLILARLKNDFVWSYPKYTLETLIRIAELAKIAWYCISDNHLKRFLNSVPAKAQNHRKWFMLMDTCI